MAKVSGSGAEGARFESHYDLVEYHLPVKLTLQFAIVMHHELIFYFRLYFGLIFGGVLIRLPLSLMKKKCLHSPSIIVVLGG